MAVTSYPGTVTPLRGLGPFTEAERDVFWGREDETTELATLVTGDGYRAGILHGGPGVGKTSLLRAGLIPHLRDHGVVAILCRNNSEPASSLAREFSEATAKAPRENESPVAFLARTVAEALRGQQYLFIFDDIDNALASRDDTVIAELADLYARVITRGGGRARFLFCCESSEIHNFGILERRTGSLFPPTSRMELEAFSVDKAATVFERMGSISGFVTDALVTNYVVKQINRGGPVTAAELQIAALAMRELRATSIPAIDAVGGPHELLDAWVLAAAESTGDQRKALRLLAPFAQGKGKASLGASWAASRANVGANFAVAALSVLSERGVLTALPVGADGDARYRLAHLRLAPPIRTLAAPAQAEAQRAFELLGAKAETGGRLDLREWLEVRRQGFEPENPEEKAVLARTMRFAKTVAVVVVAVPILLLILIYMSNSGRYYLDSAKVDGADRVVVRDGRPGLSMFHWLGFGDIVADTGLDRKMVAADKWGAVAGEDITFDSGELGGKALSILEPSRSALVRYAASGDEAALDELAALEDDDDRVAVLDKLALIGRGGDKEAAMVDKALRAKSGAVRLAALRTAVAIEARHSGSYDDRIARVLISTSETERRLAASVVNGLADKQARALWNQALRRVDDPAIKAEITGHVEQTGAAQADPRGLARLIASAETDDKARAAARETLTRLASSKPIGAIPALGEIAADTEAPQKERVWALDTLFEHTVVESEGDLKDKIATLASGDDQSIRAAALPLLARLDPEAATKELEGLAGSKSTALRAASALAWGEIVSADRAKAEQELSALITDRKTTVRAAAARAFGKLGKTSQPQLAEMAKKEGLAVATGAAFGLVETVRADGRIGGAVGGIAELWKKKGRSKRRAAEAFAALARVKPDGAASYLASAARDKDDPQLHPIGVTGLCNGAGAGGKRSLRELLSVAGSSDSVDIRRQIANCAVDYQGKQPGAAIRLSDRLRGDKDPSVRLAAIEILAGLARDEDAQDLVATKLAASITDSSRPVRIVVAEAIAVLGSAAPSDVGAKFPALFGRAGELEKLALIRAADAIGSTELVPLALADKSDRVRIAGLRLAIGSAGTADAALQAALTDSSRDVRRLALDALADKLDKLPVSTVVSSLTLASRDESREIADKAIRLLAGAGDPEAITSRLERMLASRSDADRRAAASAARGLAMQSPEKAEALLEPSLRDSARDVRAAAAISLGTALAQTTSLEDLASALKKSENKSARRFAIAAALAIKSQADRDGALTVLKELGDSGPQLSRIAAQLTYGLVDSNADALGFLAYMAP